MYLEAPARTDDKGRLALPTMAGPAKAWPPVSA
jgi:hypothetical protein